MVDISKEFINERITDTLQSAINYPEKKIEKVEPSKEAIDVIKLPEDDSIVTTEEELEGYFIVKSILREVIEITRLQYKDTKHYFGINIDGQPSKTICRLRLNGKQKYIGILDIDGKESKKDISSLDDIYGVSQILKDRAVFLTQNNLVNQT